MTIDHGTDGAGQTDVRLDGAPGLPAERQATPGSAGRRHRRQRGERHASGARAPSRAVRMGVG
jgi:hypothetical protein